MAGFTLIYQHNGLDKGIADRAEKLVESSFKIQFISKTEKLLFLFREGNHYPYEIIETGNCIIVIEGKVYSLDVGTDKEFVKKCEELINQSSRGLSESQAKYFHGLDGEFIIYILDRKGDRIVVLNDIFGRLPQYVYHKKQFILSRDIYILDKVTTGLHFDESSIYQFLRMGFPLGQRTLFYDIDRLNYSSVINIEKDKIAIKHFPIDLQALEGTYSGKNAAHDLYDCFKQATADRLKSEGQIVVSLSGGLDSRLVMGEIEKSGSTVDYASFLYDNPIINSDVEIAKALGKIYSKSPHLIELKEWAPESFDELTLTKGGMNYMGMAFLVRFLMNLGHNYNLMLTGDGGDKTLPYLFPELRVKEKRFSKYVLKKNAFSSMKTVGSFLINDVKEQEKNLKEYLDSLPGSNTNYKYKNFLLFDRAFHWLFEGEDRNRNYLWSTTPFYQPEFFRLVHSIPEKEKKNYRLMRSFGDLVDEQLNKVNNANWGMPLSDHRGVDSMLTRQRIKAMIPFFRGEANAQLSMHKEMAKFTAAMLQKGFGGHVGVFADRYDLEAASSETLFHLVTLLKISEMSWKGI